MINKIKEYRIKNNLTQEDIAKSCNTKTCVISRYENMENKPQRISKTLITLSGLMKCSVDELFKGTEYEKEINNTAAMQMHECLSHGQFNFDELKKSITDNIDNKEYCIEKLLTLELLTGVKYPAFDKLVDNYNKCSEDFCDFIGIVCK